MDSCLPNLSPQVCVSFRKI